MKQLHSAGKPVRVHLLQSYLQRWEESGLYQSRLEIPYPGRHISANAKPYIKSPCAADT